MLLSTSRCCNMALFSQVLQEEELLSAMHSLMKTVIFGDGEELEVLVGKRV